MAGTDELAGKVAIVTGAGRGMGKAVALRLAQMGAQLAINDLEIGTAEATKSEIESRGGGAIAVQGNVTLKADVARLVQATLERFASVDILVNNAGVLRPEIIPLGLAS